MANSKQNASIKNISTLSGSARNIASPPKPGGQQRCQPNRATSYESNQSTESDTDQESSLHKVTATSPPFTLDWLEPLHPILNSPASASSPSHPSMSSQQYPVYIQYQQSDNPQYIYTQLKPVTPTSYSGHPMEPQYTYAQPVEAELLFPTGNSFEHSNSPQVQNVEGTAQPKITERHSEPEQTQARIEVDGSGRQEERTTTKETMMIDFS